MSSATTSSACPLSKVELKARLIQELDDSYKGLFVFAAIALILIGLIIYCIYHLVRILTFYYYEKKRMKNLRTPVAKNDIMSDKDDNEVYKKYLEQENTNNQDEYVQYTENINKTVSEYKEYNEKLTTYYKENHPEKTAPDLVTKDVADIDLDNY